MSRQEIRGFMLVSAGLSSSVPPGLRHSWSRLVQAHSRMCIQLGVTYGLAGVALLCSMSISSSWNSQEYSGGAWLDNGRGSREQIRCTEPLQSCSVTSASLCWLNQVGWENQVQDQRILYSDLTKGLGRERGKVKGWPWCHLLPQQITSVLDTETYYGRHKRSWRNGSLGLEGNFNQYSKLESGPSRWAVLEPSATTDHPGGACTACRSNLLCSH